MVVLLEILFCVTYNIVYVLSALCSFREGVNPSCNISGILGLYGHAW